MTHKRLRPKPGQDPPEILAGIVGPKRSHGLADIRAAIAAAGAPLPPRAFTREEMEAAIGQALWERPGREE